MTGERLLGERPSRSPPRGEHREADSGDTTPEIRPRRHDPGDTTDRQSWAAPGGMLPRIPSTRVHGGPRAGPIREGESAPGLREGAQNSVGAQNSGRARFHRGAQHPRGALYSRGELHSRGELYSRGTQHSRGAQRFGGGWATQAPESAGHARGPDRGSAPGTGSPRDRDGPDPRLERSRRSNRIPSSSPGSNRDLRSPFARPRSVHASEHTCTRPTRSRGRGTAAERSRARPVREPSSGGRRRSGASRERPRPERVPFRSPRAGRRAPSPSPSGGMSRFPPTGAALPRRATT